LVESFSKSYLNLVSNSLKDHSVVLSVLFKRCPVHVLFKSINQDPLEDACWRHELAVKHTTIIFKHEIKWRKECGGTNLESISGVLGNDWEVGPSDTRLGLSVIEEFDWLTMLVEAIHLRL